MKTWVTSVFFPVTVPTQKGCSVRMSRYQRRQYALQIIGSNLCVQPYKNDKPGISKITDLKSRVITKAQFTLACVD